MVGHSRSAPPARRSVLAVGGISRAEAVALVRFHMRYAGPLSGLRVRHIDAYRGANATGRAAWRVSFRFSRCLPVPGPSTGYGHWPRRGGEVLDARSGRFVVGFATELRRTCRT